MQTSVSSLWPTSYRANASGALAARDERAALITLYVLAAATPMVSVALVQICEAVLLVLSVRLALREPRAIIAHPLFWLTAFFVLYVLIRGWAASVERPDLFHEHWEGTRRWMKAGLLPALLVMLGIWISGAREKHVLGLLIALLAGLTALLLHNADWGAFWAAIGGKSRYAFDQMLAFSSFIFGMALLGTLVFFPRIFRLIRGNVLRCVAICTAWGGLGLFYLAALVASGTRAAWIATTVGAVAAVAVGLLRWRLVALGRRELAAGLVVVAILGVVGTYSFGPRISGRIMPTVDAMSSGLQLVVGDHEIEDVPRDSLGIRIAYNVYGWQKFTERPLVGYGPANPIHLNSGDDRPFQIRGRSDHFHSTPLDAALRLGAVGSIVLVAWLGLALYGIHRGWRGGRLSPSTGLFFVGFLVAYSVWSLANVRFGNYAVSGHLALITGIACSYLLPDRLHPLSCEGEQQDR